MMRRYTLEIGGREYVVDVNELAIDSFEVMVGGDAYVVTLSGEEDLPEATVAPQVASAGTVASAGASAPAVRVARKAQAAATDAPAQRKPAGGGGASLNAPMPGVIIEIAVAPGDIVARGQLVAVLDAMKMHNNIKSPRAGTIAEVCVGPGQAVGHGDAIVRYRED
jgi:biotin carboxyl carrier protein